MPFRISSCMWLVMMTKPEERKRKRKDRHVNYTHTSKNQGKGRFMIEQIVNSAKFFNINFKMRSEYNHCIQQHEVQKETLLIISLLE